jgi:hypothetical protein
MKTHPSAEVIGQQRDLRWWSLAAGVGLTLSSLVLATPPLDPICGAPSSQQRVLALRAERLAAQARRSGVRLHGPDVPARLSIERVESPGYRQFIFQGSAGRTYELEATGNLASSQWSCG